MVPFLVQQSTNRELEREERCTSGLAHCHFGIKFAGAINQDKNKEIFPDALISDLTSATPRPVLGRLWLTAGPRQPQGPRTPGPPFGSGAWNVCVSPRPPAANRSAKDQSWGGLRGRGFSLPQKENKILQESFGSFLPRWI